MNKNTQLPSNKVLNEYKEMLTNQINWISKLQSTTGSIRDNLRSSNPISYKITPYYANIAAMAMIKDRSKLQDIKFYINWYLSKLNWPDNNKVHGELLYGTICDYKINNEDVEISTEDYDSADSYSSTFINLIRSYIEAGGNVDFIKGNRPKIEAIGKVMIQLLNKDNLSWAKPTFKIKYLMDNCEVYKGLKDLEYLCRTVFLDKNSADYYLKIAFDVKSAILSTLYNKTDNNFYVSKSFFRRKGAKWDKWYPDSTAQLFPMLYGLLSPTSSQAKYLYNKFNASWDWANFNTTDPFPWVLVGYTSAIMGDRENTINFYKNIVSKFIGKEEQTTWYSMEAGWFVLMLEKMIQNGWY